MKNTSWTLNWNACSLCISDQMYTYFINIDNRTKYTQIFMHFKHVKSQFEFISFNVRCSLCSFSQTCMFCVYVGAIRSFDAVTYLRLYFNAMGWLLVYCKSASKQYRIEDSIRYTYNWHRFSHMSRTWRFM